VIHLEKPSRVRYLRIVNRTNGFHERAEGLAVWLSDEAEQWRQVWQAEKVAPEWLVDLGEETESTGTVCRYIKIGLVRRGTLHLNQVVIFGECGKE